MQEVLEIQIKRSWRINHFCMEIGDISGRLEFYNYTEKQVLEEIKNQLKNLEEKI